MSDDITMHAATITSGTFSMQKMERWGICHFCMINSYSRHELLEKHVCNVCKDKLLKRIQLILKFE
jgi:hypothetical protein